MQWQSDRKDRSVELSSASDSEIVRAINGGSIDAQDLVSSSGWRRICQARGRNITAVTEEAWQELCSYRGYVLSRRNPRGF
jgi:hypothetical protein